MSVTPRAAMLLQHLDRLVHGAGAVVHAGQQMGVEIDHAAAAPSRSSAAANVAKPLGRLLGLGQQGEGDEGVRREQVERHRRSPGVGQHPVEGSTA